MELVKEVEEFPNWEAKAAGNSQLRETADISKNGWMQDFTQWRFSFCITGCMIFLAAYLLLPEGSVSYMGILGGIGTGLSVAYGWQAVFNAFSSLAVAVPAFGLPYAIFLRIFNNVFGSIYAWLFDRLFEPALSAFINARAFINRKLQNNINVIE